MTSNPDFNAAKEFLELLDPTTKDFCFRTFDDRGRDIPNIVGKFNDTLRSVFPTLTAKSMLGAGVFVVVNEGGQSAASITRKRGQAYQGQRTTLATIEHRAKQAGYRKLQASRRSSELLPDPWTDFRLI